MGKVKNYFLDDDMNPEDEPSFPDPPEREQITQEQAVEVKWQPIETAPRDGTEILISFDGDDISEAFWSDRPVCMLGPRNGGFPPGWATCGINVDYNLPLDEPTHWRPQ